ncbi:MAG: nitroreductase family deazaflavin-dependent oxidoreductase [Mycobacterium sp.]
MPKLLRLAEAASDTIAKAGARLLRSRPLMRAPIWLYRARLGFLLGRRLLMLEHTGRRSGLPRYVVLEVFDHPSPNIYTVASGFGTRAQWYRNIEANAEVRVSVAGDVSIPASARMLPQGEADAALQAYIRRHRRAWDALKPIIETTLGTQINDRDTALPMVELELHPS